MTADEFRSELRARLQSHATDVLLRIVVSGGGTVALTGGDILRESERLAALSSAPAGGVVLLLLPHSVELFLVHIGLVLTGRIPAILAWPTSRVDPEKYQRNLLHQFRNLPAPELITIPKLAENLAAALSYPVTGCPLEGIERWEESFSVGLQLPPEEFPKPAFAAPQNPGQALFLQFSGGTTGSQKAVAITAGMLTRQLESLREALCFSSEDVVVSWLPLYHDMGLIGCLWLPLWHAAPSVQFAANEWLLNPGTAVPISGRLQGHILLATEFCVFIPGGPASAHGGAAFTGACARVHRLLGTGSVELAARVCGNFRGLGHLPRSNTSIVCHGRKRFRRHPDENRPGTQNNCAHSGEE